MLYNCTSLGDRTPMAMLQHMRTLQPGEEEGVLFRYIFVNLLPDVFCEIVSSMDSLDEMASIATSVLQAKTSSLVASVCQPEVHHPVAATVLPALGGAVAVVPAYTIVGVETCAVSTSTVARRLSAASFSTPVR